MPNYAHERQETGDCAGTYRWRQERRDKRQEMGPRHGRRETWYGVRGVRATRWDPHPLNV